MPAGAVEPRERAEGAKGGRCGISTKDTTVRKQQSPGSDVHNITTRAQPHGYLLRSIKPSEALQSLYMSDNAVGKAIQPVSAFQDRNDTPLAEFVGEVHDNTSHRREAFRGDVELTENVISHSIKAGADQDEIRFELASCRHELVFERV